METIIFVGQICIFILIMTIMKRMYLFIDERCRSNLEFYTWGTIIMFFLDFIYSKIENQASFLVVALTVFSIMDVKSRRLKIFRTAVLSIYILIVIYCLYRGVGIWNL